MDNGGKQFITDYLQKLGFTSEEASLYVALHEQGALTLLEASRASGIDRAKLYRIIGHLAKKGLIEEIPEYKHRKIKATDVGIIDLLIKQRELENKVLANSLPTFIESMKSITNQTNESKVIYYRGVEGIKQLVWNILRNKEEFHRCYSYRFWDDIFGKAFVLKLNAAMLERNFKIHDIYSDQYITLKNEWMAKGLGKPVGDWHFFDSRYISEKILMVNHNVDIYNDVLAYYYWQGNEIFGVEIYNERVAKFEKQLFDIVWKMAKKRPELDWTKPWE